jgi:LmbE family N-acetylglucosaminyl deacetylase
MKDAVRLALARVIGGLLRAQSRPYPFPSGTALIVAPHADDESLGCGGLLAAKAQRGDPVHVVFVTDSAAAPATTGVAARLGVAARRRGEALAALREFGVPAECAHFLDAPDGRLDRLGADGAAALHRRLSALLGQLEPDEIFLPYLGGGSTEHDAASWLVRAAIAAGGRSPAIWEYPVWAWWNPLRLRWQLSHARENCRLELGALRAVKRAGLARHASQTQPAAAPLLPTVLVEACTGPVEFYFHRPG